jgi:hypothetical protein
MHTPYFNYKVQLAVSATTCSHHQALLKPIRQEEHVKSCLLKKLRWQFIDNKYILLVFSKFSVKCVIIGTTQT